MRLFRRLPIVAVVVLAPLGAVGAQTLAVQPGQWEIAVTFTSVEMPNAPPSIAHMMTGKVTTVRHCIKPEDASRGPKDMLGSDKSCTFTRYTMTGGAFSAEMACKRGSGVMTAVSTGAFTPTSFSATGRAVSAGAMPMTVTSTTVGRRVGDCK